VILAYVGGFDPAYPRNAVLRQGLACLGVEVVPLFTPPRAGWASRGAFIVGAVAKLDPAPDVVLVAEFCHKDVPAAWVAARRASALLAADPLISRADTLIEDWSLYGKGSVDGWACRRWDEIAFRWPSVVVADTRVHAERFARSVRRQPFPVVPVGADDAFFDVPDDDGGAPDAGGGPLREGGGALHVLYVGGFLPLHGVDTIFDAAESLHDRGVDDVVLECVGDGIRYHEMRARAQARGLSNVVFHGRRPLEELPARMAQADVVLGVFQKGGEGERVFPNKVVQGLAAGRCIVTADTAAAREWLTDGTDARLVPAGDGEALAKALVELRDDPAARRQMAAAGRTFARHTLTAEATARALLIALGARPSVVAGRELAREAAPAAALATPPVPVSPAGA
jgi:glycosyltransferase involved in cell wall biosynthesis